MTGVVEARELAGVVPGRPACVRLAPDPASVADLLRDESRMTAPGVASVAEPATLDDLRQVLAWHAREGHLVTVSGARTGVAGGAVPEPATWALLGVAGIAGAVIYRRRRKAQPSSS